MSGDALLEVDGLTKRFSLGRGVLRRRRGEVHAVEDVSLRVGPGETLGLVGESGCGKSTLARLVLRLIEPTAGTIRYDGRDITRLRGAELRALRRELQIVFQDPYGSLNPKMTVREIVGAPFAIHGTERDVDRAVAALLDRVGLDPAHAGRHPHAFSGGQRQRIGLARALALRPRLLVCDEPVSALDVSVQAQILNLLRELRSELGLSCLFISHDLGVVRHVADRIAVMYLGRIVELAPADALCDVPRHPYAASLLSAAPRVGGGSARIVLEGDPPSPVEPPPGCPFHPRCPRAHALGMPERCRTERPPLAEDVPGRRTACWFPVADPAPGADVARAKAVR